MALTIPWFNRARSGGGRVAISLGPDGIGLAFVNGKGLLGYCQFHDQMGDTEHLLSDIVKQQDWQGLACTVVLHPLYYKLLLAEQPEVKGDEMSSAIRWKVKELLDFPLPEAAIAHFLLPEDAYRGRQKMLYAAALRKQTLQGLVEPVEACGLAVDSVEISELALHNIISREPSDGGGIALLHLLEGEGFINLVADGAVYLTRRLDFGLANYSADKDNTRFFDSLYLELQRSVDYFESQLGKGIIARLIYSPGLDSTAPVGDFLSAQLSMNVSRLDLSVLAVTDGDITEQMVRCASAVGAAVGPCRQAEGVRAAS